MIFLHFGCWILEEFMALFEAQQSFGLHADICNYFFLWRFLFFFHLSEFHLTYIDWYSIIDSRSLHMHISRALSLCNSLLPRYLLPIILATSTWSVEKHPKLDSSNKKCTTGLQSEVSHSRIWNLSLSKTKQTNKKDSEH